MDMQEIRQSDDSIREIRRLIDAMMKGDLNARAEVARFSGPEAELMALLNQMLDVLIRPLRVTADYIDQIAHGVLPDFIIENYEGEYDRIKRNLNTLLAIMYGMHQETQYLTKAVQEGKLNTRGNSWDYKGKWEDLIRGVNETLDAVIEPVQAASVVLGSLAQYDLTAKMTGSYRGDHNRIKKALNSTGGALHSAVSQMAESVISVSAVSEHIGESAQELGEGAGVQTRCLDQTAEEIGTIIGICRENEQITGKTRKITEEANGIIRDGNRAAVAMVEEMSVLSEAARETSSILGEINDISVKTDSIAGDAASKASKVAASARGFSVVAEEVRRLSRQMKEAAEKIGDTIAVSGGSASGGEKQKEGLDVAQLLKIRSQIDEIAMKTNFLSLNAAVEAAHVGEAVAGFEQFTEEVRGLSRRTKEASNKTQAMTSRSVDLAQNGERQSQQIGRILERITEEIQEVATLMNQVADSSQKQSHGVEKVSHSVQSVRDVTRQNTVRAEKLQQAAGELDAEMQKLYRMVDRFQLGASSSSEPQARTA